MSKVRDRLRTEKKTNWITDRLKKKIEQRTRKQPYINDEE